MYSNIVILTGAGISAESGLQTFRGSGGLWNNVAIEEVATIEAFHRNPDFVNSFYNELRPEVMAVQPNAAHFALAELERESAANINIITQNVDLLHEKAGSVNVLHMHGRIDQAVCMHCGQILQAAENVNSETVCPFCKTIGMMKPNIVFFGEGVQLLDYIEKLLQECDLFIAIGTSGEVYPASNFVQVAAMNKAETYLFNMDSARNDSAFRHRIPGKATETLPPFVKRLLSGN